MPLNLKMLSAEDLNRFDRDFYSSGLVVSCIGEGYIGGKASGLAFIEKTISGNYKSNPFSGFEISIPRIVVLATGLFDRFIERNNLFKKVESGLSDKETAIEFQRAELPAEFVGDFRTIVNSINTPLAIRSSSLLEDAMHEPFAGVYATKMIPNNQPDADTRFRKLVEAIKFVYASTYFHNANEYRKSINKGNADEKMAVIIQEVVGHRFGELYYPNISGVARSYNFYSMGKARPEDGVVDLAFGLGKSIVDGGLVWSYSPAYPTVAPPTGSVRELLKKSQTKFWAVNMGKPPEHDPLNEAEYMVYNDISLAEYDRTLDLVASTYQAENDRLVTGTGSKGPRLINFAPILKAELLPLNMLIKQLLKLSEEAVGAEVEIEFAISINKADNTAFFGFLQIRPMVVSKDKIDITHEEMSNPNNLVASNQVMGNGIIDNIKDIIYVDPDAFDPKNSAKMASEISQLNMKMVNEKKKYLLIGFGRWGSSDPWLGIPVEYSQISSAGTIIEATLPNMNVELSQGSHFFHNLSSFQIGYFLVHFNGEYKIDWNWLKKQNILESTEFVHHIELKKNLEIKIDGRNGRGVILK
ncbi:MAG: PEP/pyruvate-binding domain-containing protein [Candidatus Zixiibacteriota bacterium]